jgi:hypothetical protein
MILFAAGAASLLHCVPGRRAAGVLAVLLLYLSFWGPLLGRADFWLRFEDGAIRHRALETFMRRHAPFSRPTVIVFDPIFIDMCGRYFPHDPDQPPVWFISEKDEPRARALPELADYDWLSLTPIAQP